MGERWIINASPLILLAKAEVIELLPKLCDELIIPAGVVLEVEQGKLADAGRRWLAASGKAFIRPSPPAHAKLAAWQGGAGEAEVMSWGLVRPGYIVVLDDSAARLFAKRLGLTVLGSLGIILRAKKIGLIPAAKPVLEKLRNAGAYVSDDLIDFAIKQAGES